MAPLYMFQLPQGIIRKAVGLYKAVQLQQICCISIASCTPSLRMSL